jgi:hypothetical protein
MCVTGAALLHMWVIHFLIYLQNYSKMQRAAALKEALDEMQPPPENVSCILVFLSLGFTFFCRFLF